MKIRRLLSRESKIALSIFLAGAIVSIMLPVRDALAHSFPDRTLPSAASILTEPPSQVEVHFDNPFQPSHSRVRVLNENGDEMSAGNAAVSADHRTITVPLKPLSAGQYFVKWSALSPDGDRTMGAFSFTVRGGVHP